MSKLEDIPFPHELGDPPRPNYKGPADSSASKAPPLRRLIGGRKFTTWSDKPRIRRKPDTSAVLRRCAEQMEWSIERKRLAEILAASIDRLPPHIVESINERIERGYRKAPGQRLSWGDVKLMIEQALIDMPNRKIKSRDKQNLLRLLNRI